MKHLVLLAAAVALLASPVIAQNTKTPPKAAAPTTQAAPKATTPGHGPNDVWCGGEYVGSSPDVHIRAQMLRDFKHGCE